jgi:hypothetical protein
MINKRAERELEADQGETGKTVFQENTEFGQIDEVTDLFEIDEEEDFEGSSDEMWKRDVLHL